MTYIHGGDVVVTLQYEFRDAHIVSRSCYEQYRVTLTGQFHDNHTIVLFQSAQRYLLLTHVVRAILNVTLQINNTLLSLH
jgi:hypothetical protein